MRQKLQLFDYVNMFILLVISILCIYPFLNILAVSLSNGTEAASGKIFLWPEGFNIETYKYILDNPRIGIVKGLTNSFIYTFFGGLLAVVITFCTAYALSKTRLIGRKIIMLLFIFTWVFEAGIIPNYVVYEQIGLVNSR